MQWSICDLDGSTACEDKEDTSLSNGTLTYGEEAFIALVASQGGDYDVGQGHSGALSAFTICRQLDATDYNFIKAARTIAAFANEDGAAAAAAEDADVVRLRLLWKVSLLTEGKVSNVFGIRSIALPVASSCSQQPATTSAVGAEGADVSPEQVRTVPVCRSMFTSDYYHLYIMIIPLYLLLLKDIADMLTRVPEDTFVTSVVRHGQAALLTTSALGEEAVAGQEGSVATADIISWAVISPVIIIHHNTLNTSFSLFVAWAICPPFVDD